MEKINILTIDFLTTLYYNNICEKFDFLKLNFEDKKEREISYVN